MLVNNVFENTPAMRCGIRRGDIIVEFAREKITKPEELQKVVSKIPSEKKVNVKVIRNGKVPNLLQKKFLLIWNL